MVKRNSHLVYVYSHKKKKSLVFVMVMRISW